MAKVKFTDKQKRILRRLAAGAKIRALTDKGAVLCLDNSYCMATEARKLVDPLIGG